ncbi:MAG: hypothetical protein R2769_05510 [Saprospiraceae bacterium]
MTTISKSVFVRLDITPENPLEFSVILKAEGFLFQTVKNFTITTDKPVFTFMYMVDTDNTLQKLPWRKTSPLQTQVAVSVLTND